MAQSSRASCSPVWPMWLVSRLLLLFCYALREAGGDIAVHVPFNSTGFLGGSTVLHCSLVSDDNVTVTQITWMKKNPDGSHPSVAVFHPKRGPNIVEPERVRFLAAKQDKDLQNASLAISNLGVKDEGIYECQIATFPRGSRSANVWLTVLAPPNNTAKALEPSPTLTLQDVAKCISADGHPPARIFWSSNVNGSHREMKEPGSKPGTVTVTSYYSMVPSRQADGKNITCRVEHESSQEPDQVSVILSLRYPPEVSISGYNESWHIGLTNVFLTCEARSKLAPHSYEWNTTTGKLPDTAKPQDEGKRLLISTLVGLNNTIFVCKATNALGSGQGQQYILVQEAPEKSLGTGYIILIVLVVLVPGIVLIAVCVCKRRCCLQSRPSANNIQYSSANGVSIQNEESNSMT
ncbi:poliovirus receptor homolog isoform X2 [Grammomys surdaster]|uniref:poliovirus receptor homolog isoform X2 n=1 Tax=Grammomys surdaster TaxID=491861 RepID=UPI00109F762B|nr:poliovirus receptor homolog isoform X2 [Grammomys surdaster]